MHAHDSLMSSQQYSLERNAGKLAKVLQLFEHLWLDLEFRTARLLVATGAGGFWPGRLGGG